MSDSSACGASDEEGISALEYARLNRLARNHLTDQLPVEIIRKLQESINNAIIDDSELPQLEFPTEYGTRERLSISQDGARLLAGVMQPESGDVINGSVDSIFGKSELKRCCLELPLLRGDHESDMVEFATKDRFQLQLKDVRLPLEILDVEQNEALEFSTFMRGIGTKKLNELKREKLTVTREVLQHIRDFIRSDWDLSDEERLWRGKGTGKRKTVAKPITPPLSPMNNPMNVYGPKIPDVAFEIPTSSDPISLTSLDLNKIENEIFEQDIPTPIRQIIGEQDADCNLPVGENGLVSANCAPSISGPNFSASQSSTIDDQPLRWQTLKVEEPLTPPAPIAISKTVHFSDFVEEMLQESSNSPQSDSFYGIAQDSAIGDAAKKVKQQLEQEALVVADAMGRIDVPFMDFTYPNPPWKRLQDLTALPSLVAARKATMKDILGEIIPTWPGLKHGQANLKWNPFSSDLTKAVLDEALFTDDSSWQRLVKVADDDNIADTSTLTWKPPGLKILRDEDDEEIDQASFPSTGLQDIQVLAKRRRMDFESAKGALEAPAKVPKLMESNNPQVSLDSSQSGPNDFGLLMGNIFSAENALNSFMELRGMKKQKLTTSPHFSKAVEEDQAPVQKRVLGRNDTVEHQAQIGLAVNSRPLLPYPEFRLPAAPLSVILSSMLLKNRPLVRQVETQLPDITFIERDFTAHNKIAWMPNSVTRSPVSSPLDFEADIIVSPSTGIIITTLQKVKQKSLPGQKSKPPIRHRLERASRRYEKMQVLVSESHEDESTSDMSENDCNAFIEFVGFAAGLDCTTMVHLVGGGVKTLSKWLANSIVQHAGTNSNLLEEETHWELFLRRAGMNAFAAQYISAAMRTPASISPQHEDQIDQYGLAKFVLMGRQQRIDMFGEICGKKVLERVSDNLDGRWD